VTEPRPTLMTLAQAQACIPGSQRVGSGDVAFSRVHSDTRSLQSGDLFVALRGERFDGHAFLAQAAQAGAVAALAEQGLDSAEQRLSLPGLLVPDTKAALGQLAQAWRASFELPLIAVTGSNGKTTVTQMVASILRAQWGDSAWATQGNFNNDIGVPLMLLRLRRDVALTHRAAVIELGMNHPGEIAQLAAMAAPTVALVNNAQREHQEFMASVQAVALENGQVIRALPDHGVAVFPADDDYAPLWREMAGSRRVMTFALQGQADVTAKATWALEAGLPAWRGEITTPAGTLPLVLAIAGEHNLKNALAATACALAAGCSLESIAGGLAAFEAVRGRSKAHVRVHQGVTRTLIDDSYNANPDSVRAAIDVLSSMPGPRWLLLGDMGEVGEQGPAFHSEIGIYAAERGIEIFTAVGALAAFSARDYAATNAAAGREGRCTHFFETAQALASLQAHAALPPFTSVLVKGSRFMKMDMLVPPLLQGMQPDGENHAA
jgi:UDP-N-acetylmuramoyl-tripeptide--D-alanyl-D-alanine ligase